MHDSHPESAELQRFADGERMDPQIAGHIESCALCREEIAAVRRVTAALSIGSKVPDSLAARIQARRSGSAGVASSKRLTRRARPRARLFMVPVGLAAAAVLVVFVPRAVRDSPSEPGIVDIGAKGTTRANRVLFETVVRKVGPGSIDPTSWSIAAPGIVVELRYAEGGSDSSQARRLADQLVELLRAEGVAASAISVGAEPPGTTLAVGAVRVTVLSPAQPGG